MDESTCIIVGCDKPRLARGWCAMHYRRWRVHGTTDAPPKRVRSVCAVESCQRPAKARGYCGAHYQRILSHGDAQESNPVFKPTPPPHDGLRFCRSCESWHPVGEFGSRYCAACSRARTVAFTEANPDYWREWAAVNRDRVRESVQRRRANRLSREHETIDHAAVFERDQFTCQLCGDPIAMAEKFPHPLSPSIDHVVALNRGGAHLYSNVQAAHFYCNTSKGDRDTPRTRPTALILPVLPRDSGSAAGQGPHRGVSSSEPGILEVEPDPCLTRPATPTRP